MQPGIRRCQLVPELPGAEKVQAGAEAGFTDAESGSGGQGAPAPGQIIVLQEHMAGFRQPGLPGEVHIIEAGGKGLTVFRPAQLGKGRSEERRVGKECRSGRSPARRQKNKKTRDEETWV